jgi:hypothetical protein
MSKGRGTMVPFCRLTSRRMPMVANDDIVRHRTTPLASRFVATGAAMACAACVFVVGGCR